MDIAEALQEAGFAVIAQPDLASARKALAAHRFDLLVLDVMLPDGDGVDLLEQLRSDPDTAAVPIIVLSTRDEVCDRINGITRGADEYVGKPYDTDYLVLRARQLIRRSRGDRPRTDRPLTVLLIDDSETFRKDFSAVLQSAGYRVRAAASGEQGLRMAQGERPDALIIDGTLPSMSGIDVIGKVRQDPALRRLPCLLLTAAETASDEIRGLEAGADDYVRKSADTSEVLARLKAMLRALRLPAAIRQEGGLFGANKILAVDDSVSFLNEIGEVLRADGYDVAYARSGREALQLLAVESFDCVLLDLIMEGLSGQETCRRIKDNPKMRQTPVIVLTSQEDRAAMIESMDAGADDYIAKSADFDVLRARLRAQLRRRHYELENRRISEELARKEIEATEARAAQRLAETRAHLLDAVEEKNSALEAAIEDLRAVNKELDAFTYSVSHDLQAPLRALSGYSRILREEHGGALTVQGFELVERIERAADKMKHIVDALLDLSRLSRAPLKLETVDLSGLCAQIISDLQEIEPRPALEVQIQKPLLCSGDAKLLRRLLENLLSNAWKFTRTCKKAKITVGAASDSGDTIYKVCDNGTGFDMARADRLFVPFQRLHRAADYEGTGIGLATVKRIVSRHGGRVWAEGVSNRGACFFFTLPSKKRKSGERKRVE
jgi:DNA-binding response OmpR family regulator